MFALPSDRAISPFRNDFDPPFHLTVLNVTPTLLCTLYLHIIYVCDCRNDVRTPL